MLSLTEMRQSRATAIKKANAIKSGAEALERELSSDELSKIESYVAEANDLQSKIDASEKSVASLSALDDMVASLDAPLPTKAAKQAVVSNVKDLITEDPKAGFQSDVHFFAEVVKAERNPSRMDSRLNHLMSVAGSDEQGVYDDAFGGFLVPTEFSNRFLTVDPEMDPTANLTQKIPLTGNSVDIPARVDKNHSVSVTGGFQFRRTAETQDAIASRIQMEQVNLKIQDMTGAMYITDNLLEDSPMAVGAILASSIQQEANSFVLNEKIFGNGTNGYEGIMNTSSLITVPKEVGQTADTITGQNLVDMRSRCWGYGQAIWLVNHDALGTIASARLDGTNSDNFIFTPGNGTDIPDRILGRPVFFTEYVNTVGDLGDINLCNWGEYLEASKGGLRIAESMHVRFLAREKTLRAVMRNDGKSWWNSVLTPKNGAASRSPFITLEARA